VATINELMDLTGRRALVTGATGGIGLVIAETLAELGADLLLADRPGTDLQGLAESLSHTGRGDVQLRHCDLEEQAQRDDLVAWASRVDGRLHILINNAAFVGTSELQGWAVPFEQQTVATWRRAIEVNLTAVFDLCQGLAPSLRASNGASIINIGSIYGKHGPDWRLYDGTALGNPAGYAASKGGLIQLTRWLSTTLAPGVRVNSISPGGVFRGQPTEFVQRYEARTPLGRMATEDDFRGSIAYLASDLSRYVTGQDLAVDGGWGVW
jgi:NAD(P)-dependent dehydrogenase (short-subunit alcohol dehydrogenase family)